MCGLRLETSSPYSKQQHTQTLQEKTYNHNTYTSQVPQLNRTIPYLTTQSLLAIGVKNQLKSKTPSKKK
jgi:hypothetical protein